MNSGTWKIGIIESDERFREYVIRQLRNNEKIVKILSWKSAEEYRRDRNNQELDLLYLDVSFPDASGIELARQINDTDPGLRIIPWSAAFSEEIILQTLAAGAAGYVLKKEIGDINKTTERIMSGVPTFIPALGFEHFLVSRKIISPEDLERALQEQKRSSLNRGALDKLRGVLERKALADVLRWYRGARGSLLDAVRELNLLEEEEITRLNIDEEVYRIPLGRILVRNKIISEEILQSSVREFEAEKLEVNQVRGILRDMPLFNGLDDASLITLTSEARRRILPAGKNIYNYRSSDDSVYIVESGLVRLSSANEGREINRLHSGDFFGLYSALAENIHMERAETVTESIIWSISGATIRELMQKNHFFAQNAAQLASKNIVNMLSGLSEGEGVLLTSNINALFLGAKADRRDVINALIPELFEAHRGSLLVITSFDNPFWSGRNQSMQDGPAPGTPARIMENMRGTLHVLHWPRIEYFARMNALSRWLRRESRNYDSIVFLTRLGKVDFRKFLMGVARKTAFLIAEKAPHHIGEAKENRDRVFLMGDLHPDNDLPRYNELKRLNARVLSPIVIRPRGMNPGYHSVARYLVGKTLGLALAGGGARCMAHLGVYEVLQSHGIETDLVSGTSGGAVIGAAIAMGASAEEIRKYMMKEVAFSKPFNDWTWPRVSLIKGKRGERLLRGFFRDGMTYHARIPYYPVATRMDNGEEIVLKGVEYLKACMASGAAPGLLPPQEYDGLDLLDGGLINNLPSSVLKDARADIIVGVNTNVRLEKAGYRPNRISSIMMRFIDIMFEQSINIHYQNTDIEIRPLVDQYSVFDWDLSEQIIETGREAAQLKIDEIKKRLQDS